MLESNLKLHKFDEPIKISYGPRLLLSAKKVMVMMMMMRMTKEKRVSAGISLCALLWFPVVPFTCSIIEG